MKHCPTCHVPFPDEFSFCPRCQAPLEQRSDTLSGTGDLTLGDGNVVAGDVIARKDDYHIAGNATIVQWSDPSRAVVTCSVCGRNCLPTDGHTCPGCGRFVCIDHFDAVYRVCIGCDSLSASVSPPDAAELQQADEVKLQRIRRQLHSHIDRSVLLEQSWELWQRHRNNLRAHGLYLEVLADTRPADVVKTPLPLLLSQDQLLPFVAAHARTDRFGQILEHLQKLTSSARALEPAIGVIRAGLEIDLFHQSDDHQFLESSAAVLSAAENLAHGSLQRLVRFFAAYRAWSDSGHHIRALATALSHGEDSGLHLWRTRRSLAFLLDPPAISRLTITTLHCPDGSVVPLRFSAVLGRSAGPLIPQLSGDDSVSRHHAALLVMPDLRVMVRDLGSTNGTSVNGRSIGDQACELCDGDVLELGDSRLTVELHG